MMTRCLSPSLSILFVAVCCLVSATARGELKTFTVDTNQSLLTISGTFTYETTSLPLEQQGPGSLTTHYTGTILANVTDSTITFVGGSSVIGLNSGSWQPLPGGALGSAPANYGGKVYRWFLVVIVDAKAAVRDALLDVTSGVLPITATEFSSQGLVFNFPPEATTVLDYNYSGVIGSGSGSQLLTDSSTNSVSTNATLKVVGGELVLTIPVDISGTATALSPDDVQYRFRGQVVARAPVSVPLQINAFRVSPGQLTFTIATTPGQAYTILGSADLTNWPTIVDQFTATTNPTIRNVSWPTPPPAQYFRVRRD